MEVKIHDSIDKIEKSELDTFKNSSYSKEFYQFVEAENKDKVKPKYFLLYKENKLRAFAPAFIQKSPISFDPEKYLAGRLFKLLKIFGLKINSSLIVHTPYRLRSDIISTGEGEKKAILNEIIKESKRTGCNGIIFPYVLETNKEADTLLIKNGFIKTFIDANFYLDINFNSFEEFLKSFTKHRRRQYRYANNIFHRYNSKIVDIQDIDKFAKILSQLHKKLMEKYGHSNVEMTEESFINFYRYIKNIDGFYAEENNNILGFVINFYEDEVYHVFRCSQDYNLTENRLVYFYLVYNETIRRAIQLGCKKIDYGFAAHKTKLLRGCKYEKAYIYFKFFNPIFHNLLKFKIKHLGKCYYSSFLNEIDYSKEDNAQ